MEADWSVVKVGGDRCSMMVDALRAFVATTREEELAQAIVQRTAQILSAECLLLLPASDPGRWRGGAGTPGFAPVLAAHHTQPIDASSDPVLRRALDERTALLAPTGKGRGSTTEDGAKLIAAGAQSAAYLPLLSDSQWMGFLILARFDGTQAQLDASDLAFAEQLATIAAMALKLTNHDPPAGEPFTSRRRMWDHLRVLAQASRDFSAVTADYRELLQVVARTAGQYLGEISSVRLVSPDGSQFRVEDAAVFHPDPEISAAFRQVMLETPQSASSGLAARVLSTGKPLLVTASDANQLYEQTPPAYRPLLERLDIVSALLVPVISRGRTVGVLGLSRRRGSPAYDADEVRLAQDLADRAGLAIENAVLLADLGQQVADNKKAEVKFRGLLESAPDAIVIIDYQGRIVLINAQTEALFGYSRAELLGQTVEMLVPAGYRRQHPELRSGYFRAPRLRHAMAAGVDLFGLKKDGTEFPAEISLSPIATPEGQLVTAVIRDITERKRLEESRAHALELETQNQRVQEANRLKSEFLANMSHELRTPLNAIIGFSALLHAGRAGPLSETQIEYLGDILVSSRHLLQLINDVLDLAKVEAGRIDLQPEPIDLNRVTGEVRDILRGLAAEKHVAISFQVDESLNDVVTDARALKQILYNYLSNAIKFTPENGAVRTTIAASNDDTFRVSVEDNGIGIRTEDLERLFVEFQQLDSSSAKKYPGTGLGLALTKRVVEAQGGSVSVVSEPGKGSTFSANLPRILKAT
ncbi:MAG TPA: ATP-binding protein [Polyangiaceae bacterium]|nr:ATP-binding protein [Polyangiaceae bacterium]